MHIFGVLIAIIASIIGVIGDYFINLAGEGKKYIEWKWFIIGFITYAMTAVGWFFAMKHVKLAHLGVVYLSTTMLGLVFIGYFLFNEKINFVEAVGIGLALTSLFLMARFA